MAIARHSNLRPPGLPPAPPLPLRRPSEKLSYPKTALGPVQMCVKFQHSSSNSFRDMRGYQIYTRGAAPLRRPLAEKFSSPKSALGPI